MNSLGANQSIDWEQVDWTPVVTRRISTFSRDSKIFQQTHYYANPIMYSFAEMEEMAYWCHDTFGPRGFNPKKSQTGWDFQNDPDYIFWFSDEKNLMLFILRWS